MSILRALLLTVFFCGSTLAADVQQVRFSGTVLQITDRGLVVQVQRVTNWTNNKDTIPSEGQLVLVTDYPKANDVATGEAFFGEFSKGELIETADKSLKLRIWKFVKEWNGL